MRNAKTRIIVTFSVNETNNDVCIDIINDGHIESIQVLQLNPDRPIDAGRLTDDFIHAVESTVNDLFSKCLLGFYAPRPGDDNGES
jgi:hypothetical protein